jgi:NAD(P) transhydrogenase
MGRRMDEARYDYDLLVIGSGPAGQKAAIQAAKLRKRVAVVERRSVVGGVCINTGTIPSKTLREAALYLSGYREHAFYGASYAVKQTITMADLLARCQYVIEHENDVIRHQMVRNGIEVIGADASFAEPHTVHLRSLDGHGSRDVTAGAVVIAAGTTPVAPPDVPLDGRHVVDSDGILTLEQVPRTLVVVGAGVIGCEYAAIFATLGVRVTLIDARPQLLPFVDRELVDALEYHLRTNRVLLRLGETVSRLQVTEDGRVWVGMASGKQVIAECALFCAGRRGATESLNLEVVGVTTDRRGQIEVNEHYQTAVPHIYAVGDVIGFPSLASTSMEQGRLAACHAFGVRTTSRPEYYPYGIYTIPEISMVGKTEEELTSEGVPYEIGKAQYKEIARGQIIGDSTGVLKLIFHFETRKLLGVHIIGDGASELVHVGQAVLAFGGTIDYFVNTVFNYPTLAEAYKVAALDGINRLDG